jgi:hypothetical protein
MVHSLLCNLVLDIVEILIVFLFDLTLDLGVVNGGSFVLPNSLHKLLFAFLLNVGAPDRRSKNKRLVLSFRVFKLIRIFFGCFVDELSILNGFLQNGVHAYYFAVHLYLQLPSESAQLSIIQRYAFVL